MCRCCKKSLCWNWIKGWYCDFVSHKLFNDISEQPGLLICPYDFNFHKFDFAIFLQFLLYFAIKMAYHHYVQTNWKHIVVEEKLLNTNQKKLLIPVNLGLYYLHYSMMFIIWTVIFFSGHARGDNLKECSVIFAIQCISYKDKFILRLIFA